MYTKGEWKVRKINLGYLVLVESPDTTKQPDSQITLLNFGGQNEANAYLISAAPDLYEALKELIECYHTSIYTNDQDRVSRAWLKAKQSLTKAEGKL